MDLTPIIPHRDVPRTVWLVSEWTLGNEVKCPSCGKYNTCSLHKYAYRKYVENRRKGIAKFIGVSEDETTVREDNA